MGASHGLDMGGPYTRDSSFFLAESNQCQEDLKA